MNVIIFAKGVEGPQVALHKLVAPAFGCLEELTIAVFSMGEVPDLPPSGHLALV